MARPPSPPKPPSPPADPILVFNAVVAQLEVELDSWMSAKDLTRPVAIPIGPASATRFSPDVKAELVRRYLAVKGEEGAAWASAIFSDDAAGHIVFTLTPSGWVAPKAVA